MSPCGSMKRPATATIVLDHVDMAAEGVDDDELQGSSEVADAMRGLDPAMTGMMGLLWSWRVSGRRPG